MKCIKNVRSVIVYISTTLKRNKNGIYEKQITMHTVYSFSKIAAHMICCDHLLESSFRIEGISLEIRHMANE